MTPSILLALLLLALLFAPRYGLLSLQARLRAERRREQIEDALKLLLDYEQRGLHPATDTLAGGLQVSRTTAAQLVQELVAQGLVSFQKNALHLTPEGERWAMQIVRAHRLWERYLADEARMPLERVHREAHRREHHLTLEQIEALDAALGYPQFDPHGDPIPRPAAERLQPHGVPLPEFPDDTPGRIIHLEDEPPLAYAQILAEGLHVGQQIRVLERTPQRIVLSDGENEYRLAPAVAANVHVEPLTEAAAPLEAVPLHQIPRGQPAEILAIAPTVQGFTRRRFLDLGLTPGAIITPELENFFREPRGYRVRGTLIALRNDQAAAILVKPLEVHHA